MRNIDKNISIIFLILFIISITYVPFETIQHFPNGNVLYRGYGYHFILNPPSISNKPFNPFEDTKPLPSAQVKWSQVGIELIVLVAAYGIIYVIRTK